ncbi:MAG: T9SS type A sorting domain-containing protein [Bacteroidota bacterium]
MNQQQRQFGTFLLLLLLLGFGYYWSIEPSQPATAPAFDAQARYDAKHAPADHFFLQRSFPNGEYPLKTYKKAMRAVGQKARTLARTNNQGGFATPWTIQGPGNTGARVNSIAIHPSSEDTIYAGFSAGGIFKTTDGGANWQPIFDDQPYLAIGDIVLDPQNPNTIYVGTGDPSITGYPFIGDGVYKSTDGGQTWAALGLSQPGIISKIEIDPTNSDIIYAASMGLPFERNFERGVYKSIDGGANWTQIFNIDDSTGVIDLLVHPDQPQILYAAGWTRIRTNQESAITSVGPKVFRSTDGGETWLALDGGLPNGLSSRVGLAIAPSNPNVIFALYIDANFDLMGIYKSSDGGDSWSLVIDGNSLGLANIMGGMGWYFGRMRVHPTDPDQLYVLGLRTFHSVNGGLSWTNLTPVTGPSSPHVDHHELTFSHLGNLYLGTDGGIYRQAAGSNTWEDIEQIPTAQVYRTAYNPHEPQIYYAGAQDNGTHQGNASTINSWTRLSGGDGFQMAFHPTNPNIRYVESQFGNIAVTIDGTIYQSATLGIPASDRKNWDMPYIISPNNPSVLYTGTQRVYRNTTSGVSPWSPISADLTDGNIFGAGFHTISTLDESPQDSLSLYVGTTDANVWRTTDSGNNWERVDANLPERYVTSIKAAPDFAEQVYVTFSGYRQNDFTPLIYHSTDRGDQWTAIHGNLPQLAINDLYVLPNHAGNVLFVATDGGVYATTNAGVEWTRMGSNFPVVPVYDLAFNWENNLLIAATFARSILTFPLDSIDLSPEPPASTLVEGTVLTETGEIIDSVQVRIGNGVEAVRNTGTSGTYAFPAVPLGQTCTIKAQKEGPWTNGVNIFDIFLLQQHILNTELLDSPYKMLAADLDRSESVNIVDILLMQKLILLIDTTLANHRPWFFIPSDHVFTNPLDPWENPIPETYTCADLEAPSTTANFIGLKVGDADASANLQLLQSGETRETLPLATAHRDFVSGEDFILDFYLPTAEHLGGVQLDLAFDPQQLRLEKTETLDLEDLKLSKERLDEGHLLAIWSRGELLDWEAANGLFRLHFRALADGQTNKALSLSSRYLEPFAFEQTSFIKPLTLQFEQLVARPALASRFEIRSQPNPFREFTIVSWTLPEAGEGQLFLYDAQGRLLWQRQDFFAAGIHQQRLEAKWLEQPGVYWLQIRFGQRVQQQKLLFLD